MKAKEIQNLESYFKTDNEHWNAYTFEMLCEVLKQGVFDEPKHPLELFSSSISIIMEEHDAPLKVVQEISKEIESVKLNSEQELFIYEWIIKYLKRSSFDGFEVDEVKDLLSSKKERLKNELKKVDYDKPKVGSIRDMLKEQMKKELEQLPETLKELEPIQRLNVLCKLIPYVLPKVEAVHSEKGEPNSENTTSISGFEW